jgi:protein-tyrosine-phosphatase
MTIDNVYHVLFLCTGNSARSILGEALLNHWGKGRFRGFSAGSMPRGEVHPMAIQLLARRGLPVAGLRSKSWEEFSGPGAPAMDFVFTVCGNAAAEACPVWPGHPVTAHWGIPDPVAVEGEEELRMQAFEKAFRQMEDRIRIFVDLPIRSLDRLRLGQAVDQIGQHPDSRDRPHVREDPELP